MNIFRSGMHSQSFYAGLWNTISKEKKLWQGTIINRIKDGTFIDCASTIFPILDHNRTIIHYVTIQENVTERNIKDKLFIMQTRQAQMGEMLSMIAHQWRQPLAVIGTLLNKERVNLVLHEPNVEELMQNFDDIEAQVQHLSRTISDFRDFFKPDKEQTITKNSQIVSKAVVLLEHMLKQKNIVLVQEHEQDEEYKTYEHEMIQVILNLVKNAQDAFEEKNIPERKIIIQTSQHRGYSIIRVEDNAGGVSPSVHDTLFMPYVTTKNEQNGTGLGLYMSKTIVEDHCGGKLTFHNTEDGAVFTIKLPLKGEHD